MIKQFPFQSKNPKNHSRKMLPNYKPQNFVSVQYKRDDELTELEKKNKQLLLNNIVKEEMEKRNKTQSTNQIESKSVSAAKIQNNEKLPSPIKSLSHNTNVEQIKEIKQNEQALKQQSIQTVQKQKEENKQQNESTENDLMLAQILQQEINQSRKVKLVSRSEQKPVIQQQAQNISIPVETLLTEKERRFLLKQKEELEKYEQEKNQNEGKLMEVNDDFINNIFNKQFPNNQKILNQIKKDSSKHENPALQVQRRSQQQIKEEYQNQFQKEQKQRQQQRQQDNSNYVSPNQQQQQDKRNEFRHLLNEVQPIKYCSFCGEYQRESQIDQHQSRCLMQKVRCDFCNEEYPRYIINDHTGDCLKREERKLLDLYQQSFAAEGQEVNQTHQIYFGSRENMRREFARQTFEQQKEIERLILQNQRKIKKSYQNKNSRSEYYADVKYIKDPQSTQTDDCSICFVTFEEKETLGMLPCAHKFHSHCIDSWIKVKKVCPLCKRPF